MSQVVVYRLVLESQAPPQEFPLMAEYVYIGRAPNNDIVIENEHVSRQHARLIRQKDRYLLEDLDSTNGTFVNDQRITHAVLLQPGDRIRLGPEVVLRFTGPEVDLEPTVRVPVVEEPAGPGSRTIQEEVRPAEPLVTPPPVSPAAPSPAAPTAPPGDVPAPSAPMSTAAVSVEPRRAVPVSPVPVAPRSSSTPQEIVYPPRRSSWTWVALGCAGVAILTLGACIAWLWWVDANNLWCTYELFRQLLPGCP